MLLKIGAIIMAALAAVGGMTGLLLLHDGFIIVEVEERHADGTHLWIPVPVSLVRVGMNFAPRDELAQAARELEPYREVVLAVLDELANCPDAVFVEVEDGADHVIVKKEGGNLIVDVDEPGERVYVKIPIDSVSLVINKLADAGVT